MKKRNILIGLICLLMVFVLTGCKNKTAITTSDFKTKAEGLGYTTADVLDKFSTFEYVKEATVAQSADGFQVEFYVLDNESNATGMFNTNKTSFESSKSGVSSESSVNMANYSTYTLTSNGYYMHLCRVDNTLLYVKVKESKKDAAKKLIDDLDY